MARRIVCTHPSIVLYRQQPEPLLCGCLFHLFLVLSRAVSASVLVLVGDTGDLLEKVQTKAKALEPGTAAVR